MQKRNSILLNLDWISVLIYILLVTFGWINIYSSAYVPDDSDIFDFSLRHGKQLIWIAAAILLSIIILIIDAKFYAIFSTFIYAFLMLLLLVVLFFGKEVNGAKSWFEIGSFGLQPAEFAKLGTALILAKVLSTYGFKLEKMKNLALVALLILLPMALILLQNDTGSAMVFVIFILVLYREGLPGSILLLGVYLIVLFVLSLLLSKFVIIISFLVFSIVLMYTLIPNRKEVGLYTSVYILSIAVVFVLNELFTLGLNNFFVIFISILISLPFFIFWFIKHKIYKGFIVLSLLMGSIFVNYSVDYVFNNVLEEHHQRRVNDLLGIESDPLGWGYNVNQSKIAIGSGGYRGQGFLKGTQTKFRFVPEQSTDFIFCTVGEEWGFLGTATVILLYVALLLRLIYLAERQRSVFSRVYMYGVASIIFFHFFVNIGMTIGIVPVIGIPLPFFSYGGSSLWGFTTLLFIALKLDTARREVVL